MSTTEDVFYLYERNSSIYHDHRTRDKYLQGEDENEDQNSLNDDNCFRCSYNTLPVLPNTIGNTEVPCNIKRKCYIKPGEECAICMEQIVTKTSAYLTSCGHSFHKSCIFKCMETKWNSKYGSNFKCPLCRTNLGMDIHNMGDKYDMYNESINNLDILENFWMKKEFYIPLTCQAKYDHYLGMKKDCKRCQRFISEGRYAN